MPGKKGWENILSFVRGRKIKGSEGILSAVTWSLCLLVMVVETVEANRPPRFVLDGNIGSEIVVRMREGEEGGRGRRVVR